MDDMTMEALHTLLEGLLPTAATSRALLSTVIYVTLIGSADCLVSRAIFNGSIFGVSGFQDPQVVCSAP